MIFILVTKNHLEFISLNYEAIDITYIILLKILEG